MFFGQLALTPWAVCPSKGRVSELEEGTVLEDGTLEKEETLLEEGVLLEGFELEGCEVVTGADEKSLMTGGLVVESGVELSLEDERF